LHRKDWLVVFPESLTIPNRSFVVSRIERIVKNEISVSLHNKVDVRETSLGSMRVRRPDGFIVWSVHDEVSIGLNDRVILSILTGKFFILLQHFCHVQLELVLRRILLLSVHNVLLRVRLALSVRLLLLSVNLRLNLAIKLRLSYGLTVRQ
jgi:hypothetical protein